MATDLRNLPAFLGDDATFRLWGVGLAAQLAAVGLVQTADTGQVNWASVSRPGGSSTTAGYEIWRFNDALQATKPVFIRIDYGVAAAVDRPRFIITVGTATNGAGTITGQVGTAYTYSTSASKTVGVTLPSYCSGSTSRLSLMTHLDASNANFFMLVLVERPKTAAGVETGDFIVTALFQQATGQFQLIPYTGSVPTSTSVAPAVSAAGTGMLSSVGLNVALCPLILMMGVVLTASCLVYAQADIGELTSFTATHMGATHTFMPLGDGGPVTKLTQAQIAGMALAMMWE